MNTTSTSSIFRSVDLHCKGYMYLSIAALVLLIRFCSTGMLTRPTFDSKTRSMDNCGAIEKSQKLLRDSPTKSCESSVWDTWISSFEAADPRYQEYCLRALHKGQASSQFGQDMFLFNNFFKEMTCKGIKGVYIDSGTNDPEVLSNTFFFDKCLGWRGICVEPSDEYHESILAKRSCDLFAGCINSQSGQAKFSGEGVGGFVSENGEKTISCLSLADLMQQFHINHVDLWSLDVEGHEVDILNATNFDELSIDYLLVEDFWVKQRDLDLVMTRNGYSKIFQLAIDSIYMKTRDLITWRTAEYDKFWKQNMDFRETVKHLLTC